MAYDKKRDSPLIYAHSPSLPESVSPPHFLQLPFMQGRRIRVPTFRWFLPNPNNRPLSLNTAAGHALIASRRRLVAVMIIITCSFLFLIIKIKKGHSMSRLPFTEESTLVLSQTEIARVWAYEIAAGRYPSKKALPRSVKLKSMQEVIENPGLPPSLLSHSWATTYTNKTLPTLHRFQGTGSERIYNALPQPMSFERAPAMPHQLAYPPRPLARSSIDLDVIMQYCDFSLHRYVRDCLEILKIGAGLDPQARIRRGTASAWHHVYREEDQAYVELDNSVRAVYESDPPDIMAQLGYRAQNKLHRSPKAIPRAENSLDQEFVDGFKPKTATRRKFVGAGRNRQAHPTHETADPACDPDYPRIFHIFWAGPFTDKPYLAALSFLYTQNLGLHLPLPESPTTFEDPVDPDSSDRDEFLSNTCRPQLWIWINPGPASAVPNPSAKAEMFESLADNPWSAPFLHTRFQEVIKFKLWNTTEQLDGVPELRDFWRDLPLFNSGGVKYKNVPTAQGSSTSTQVSTSEPLRSQNAKAGASPTKLNSAKGEDVYQRVGSTSSSGYDRLSVVLSDMARFVLCHRFGGVYLDADTILLRDWEELWGWRGAFAYRWSRLEKYNTAVLKLQRNSAIGSFLFKTALANGLDFHPMTISRYTKDASLEGLLLRLPDALFDPAWLNTEYYQRDRPPFPYMKRFEDFFDPPSDSNAAPSAVGFDGFFKGAFSYHFHNFWWIPFDPARNWPDIGPRFAASERKARLQALQANLAAAGAKKILHNVNFDEDFIEDDQKDLGWATVLKRTFESYIRGERPNMYGEFMDFSEE